MVMAAILSVPMALGTQSAMAGGGSTPTTGSLAISAVCELSAPGTLTFNGGNPESNGLNIGTGETAAFVLSNANGNLDSVVTVLGSNWFDSAGSLGADDVMEETHSRYDTTGTTAFTAKTQLTTSAAALTTITAGNTDDTFWDVEIVLDIDATFAGTANQNITFDFTCA